MHNNDFLTIERVTDCKNPYVSMLLFEFKMGLDLFFQKDHEIFQLIINLTKDLAHVFNKVEEFILKENKAINRLKKDLKINNDGLAIKMPSRGVCEKLFHEIMQDSALIRRRHAKLFQILFEKSSGRPQKMIEHFKDIFGENSNEYLLLHDNNIALQFLWDIRGEIEHPDGQLEYRWLQTDNKKITPSMFSFRTDQFIVRDYILETSEFLLFLTEFLIASGISSRVPGIKYFFNQKSKLGEFRWNPHILEQNVKIK